MIYPQNFEEKIGFNEIRTLLKDACLSALGKERVDNMGFSTNAKQINTWLTQVREFRALTEEKSDLPLRCFFDMRVAVKRLRIDGTHLTTDELFDLRRSLETVALLAIALRGDDEEETRFPALRALTEGVSGFPNILKKIDQILDQFGRIRDDASPQLQQIRRDMARAEGSVRRALYAILASAQGEGLVEKDVQPAMRDGRLVIPVAPAMKRKIKGIVHDESATGRTVFIEPAEVVEANNHIRELESDERREIARILMEMSDFLRPYADDMLLSYRFLAAVDFLQAKAHVAVRLKAMEPHVSNKPQIDWIRAFHPLLCLSLEKQNRETVPLDMMLTDQQRLLIISGPNAGGKSVCLKTVGLLQYMLQCGLSIPVGERSRTGIFNNIMIDIGDEQSIENDLSTYSSHLGNMKQMIRRADAHTLLLIDEMGSGTEPQIGGAIAEAVLKMLYKQQAFGIVTTHYQNLKHFADTHEGVVNGAMLYDRQQMQALFKLSIGQPGSSFAIEIARKTGLPDEVIRDASEIVGSDYIQSDKYLQDIVRDKRYWESKRQSIHQREKELEQTVERLQGELDTIKQQRKEVMLKAKQQADELLHEANRRIENTIREIRESQAEKETARRLRSELNDFAKEIDDAAKKADEELVAKKMQQILQRRERQQKRKVEKQKKAEQKALQPKQPEKPQPPTTGDMVRIKTLQSVGILEAINGKEATVLCGDMRLRVPMDQLEKTSKNAQKTGTAAEKMHADLKSYAISRATRDTIEQHSRNFSQDIDVRGMRADEALNAVQHFIDDAILVGVSRVRILHGKGNGILRQLIRQYLSSVPNVSHFADEHVQFGGAGITVVDIS